ANKQADFIGITLRRGATGGGSVVAARIGRARFRNTNFYTSNNTQLAFYMQLDNFNTTVESGYFEGYSRIGPDVTIGYGVNDAGNTTPETKPENLVAPLASPSLTGTPTAPTAAPGTNTNQVANTAFVKAATTPTAPVTVTATAATAASGTKYITNNASRVTVTLPLNASSNVGDQIFVRGLGAGGWRLAQPEAGTIVHGSTNTTTGTSGYVQSGGQFDTIAVEKVAANEWTIIGVRGSVTIN
ncbi:hypothetical protein, partial [Larkinella ripae]